MIIWRLRLRCLRFFLQGMLFIGPAPYFSDGRCWSRGAGTTVTAIAISIPVAIFAAGVIIGRL